MHIEPYQIYAVTAGVLFPLGLVGLFLCRHVLKRIVAMQILGASVFLLLISMARRDLAEFADPVPHAMVVTGIVVSLSTGAFALVLARRIFQTTGRTDLEEET